MDIQDSALRLDVLPTVPSTGVERAPLPVPAGETPSFADSFQRAQPQSAATSASAAPFPANPGPAAVSVDATAAGDSGTSPAIFPDSPIPVLSGLDDSTTVAIDAVLQSLIDGLAAMSPVVPVSPITADVPASPLLVTPVGLARGLQPASSQVIPAVENVTLDSTDALPVMPAGLQSGLRAAVRGSERTSIPVPAVADNSPVDSSPATSPFITEFAALITTQSSAPNIGAASQVTVTPDPAQGSSPTVVTSSIQTPVAESVPTPLAAESTPTVASREITPAGKHSAVKHPAATQSEVTASSDQPPGITLTVPSVVTAIAPAVPRSAAAATETARPPAVTSASSSGVPSPHSVPAEEAPKSGVDAPPWTAGSEIIAPSWSTSNRPETVAASPSAVIPGPIPPVMEQLQPALQRAVTHDHRLTMTLRPPELGAVHIDITRHEGKLHARLQTETAAGHQLLTEHLSQLRDTLAPLGVPADQVQIVRTEPEATVFPENQTGQGPQTDARQSGARQDAPQPRPTEPHRAEEPEREEAAQADIRTRTALNLRI